MEPEFPNCANVTTTNKITWIARNAENRNAQRMNPPARERANLDERGG
jgi:hypothetical protein